LSVRFGDPHHHHESTDSTNQRARELAETGAPSGTVVTADSQSAGRGRQGRRWSAPPGAALLYSAVLRPLDLRHLLLPLAVPLAVCDACERLAPVSCRIKWPNDIWLEERKLAGVLIEARPPEWAVIGVGVNVAIDDGDFPEDLRWPAVSLGHDVEVAKLRAELDRSLGRWVEADDRKVLAAYGKRDALRGRPIAWEGGPDELDRRGVAEGIDDRGNLVVRSEAGETVALGSGEVHLRLL
jgi:BirA family transcriptional regulator, biotin operon repressor / biotin---[acetyl-CoA-carboxylase] ligase